MFLFFGKKFVNEREVYVRVTVREIGRDVNFLEVVNDLVNVVYMDE